MIKATTGSVWTDKSGAVDLYCSAYSFGGVDIAASLALTEGASYMVTVSGVYAGFYSYGIAADAIKLVHLP